MHNEPTEVGRKLVFRVAAIAVTASLLTILTVNVVEGSDRLLEQAVRFGLTVALCLLLVRGRPWARWISIVLFLVTGLAAILGSLGLFQESMWAVAVLVIGVAYLYCAGVLLGSSSVRVFFNSSRPATTPSSTSL